MTCGAPRWSAPVTSSRSRAPTVTLNFAADVGVPTEQEIREVARRIAGEGNGESLERIVAALRESIEQNPRPLFLERAFFTAAGVREP